MKRNYTVYRPTTLIRDFYDGSAAYYHAEDVSWSPFTPVGKLDADSTPSLPAFAPRSQVNPVRTPVFPTGFSLDGIVGTPQRARRASSTVAASGTIASPLFTESLLDVASRVWHRISHVRFWPKKYSLDRGVYIDISARMRALSAVGMASAVLLAFVLFEALGQGSPSSPTSPVSPVAVQPKSAPTVTITPAASHSSATSLPSTFAASTPRSSSLAGTVAPVVNPIVSAPITGGMGAGPVDTTTPTGGDTTTTPADPTPPTDGGTDPTNGGSDGTPVIPPITVPGVDVQLGDTSLLQTSPISLGL